MMYARICFWLILLAAGLTRSAAASDEEAHRFRFISTWSATQPAIHESRQVMLRGGKLLDAVEQGIRLEEANRQNSSVGIGGIPNADGIVQLDACIMNGPGHQAGAIAAIEDVLHPISVARKVMETTKHVMLVGDGAQVRDRKRLFDRATSDRTTTRGMAQATRVRTTGRARVDTGSARYDRAVRARLAGQPGRRMLDQRLGLQTCRPGRRFADHWQRIVC